MQHGSCERASGFRLLLSLFLFVGAVWFRSCHRNATQFTQKSTHVYVIILYNGDIMLSVMWEPRPKEQFNIWLSTIQVRETRCLALYDTSAGNAIYSLWREVQCVRQNKGATRSTSNYYLNIASHAENERWCGDCISNAMKVFTNGRDSRCP